MSHDSVKSFNDPIPKNKIRQFTEILSSTGGRYLSNPREYKDYFRVDYIHGDYQAFNIAWRLCNQDVKEIRKDQTWRKILRRLRNFWKS